MDEGKREGEWKEEQWTPLHPVFHSPCLRYNTVLGIFVILN